MPTLINLDGFAHQTKEVAQGAGSGFIGIYDTVANAGGLSFVTGDKRLAGHVACLKVIENGSQVTGIGRNIAAGNRVLVASFYIRITAAPSVTSYLFLCSGPTNVPLIGMDSTGHLLASVVGGAGQTTSGTYADGLWHLIDVRFDTSGTTYTIDWKVDGATQTQATRTGQTAADLTAYRYGSTVSTHTLTCEYQDFVLSATTGDYPIGPHHVFPLYPTGEGTETLGSSNKIQDEAAGQTNLYQKADDWNGGTPDTATYVTYASTTTGDAASNFAEFTMSNPDAGDSTIWDVIGYVAGFASGTSADNATTKVMSAHGGTQLDTIGSAIDYSGSTTALGYYYDVTARPAGGWDVTKLSNVVIQWGFSTDTNPIPRLSAVMLEYAAPETPAASGSASTTNASSSAATDKKNGIGAPSVSHTSASAATDKKNGKGAASTTNASATAATDRKNGKATASVSHASATAATGTAFEPSGGDVLVEHATATAATGTKKTTGVASTSAASATAATDKKNGIGAPSVSHATATAATDRKNGKGTASTTNASAAAATDRKNGKGTASTTNAAAAAATGTSAEAHAGPATVTHATATAATGTKRVGHTASTTSASSATVSGTKAVSRTASVSHATSVATPGRKGARAALVVSHLSTASSSTTKHAASPISVSTATDAQATGGSGTHAVGSASVTVVVTIAAPGTKDTTGAALVALAASVSATVTPLDPGEHPPPWELGRTPRWRNRGSGRWPLSHDDHWPLPAGRSS